MAQHKAILEAERRKAKKRNRAIRRANRNRATFNRAHPGEPQLELLPKVPVPSTQPVDLDLSPAIVIGGDFDPVRLPLREIATRLNPMLRRAGDASAAIEVSYNYVFRGLSTLGAHTNFWVIDGYISGRDRNFLRVADRPGVPPMLDEVAHTAIVLTAFLALTVLESEAEAGLLATAAEVWAATELRTREHDHGTSGNEK